MSSAFGTPSFLLDRGEPGELLVRAGRLDAECANALGDKIDREGELGVLRLEHEVQGARAMRSPSGVQPLPHPANPA